APASASRGAAAWLRIRSRCRAWASVFPRDCGGRSGRGSVRRARGVEQRVDAREQRRVVGPGATAETRDDVAVAVDEILVEVPARRLARGCGELAIERGRLVADHVHLLEHRELHAVGQAAELLDLGFAAGL